MKKLLIILAVLFWTVLGLKAQQNGIIYTDFNPDLCVEELSPYDSHDTLKIDLDHDGTMDFKMYIESRYSTMVRHVYVTSSWDFRYCYNSIYSYGYMDENDTIIPNHSIWAPANSTWELLWSDYGPYMKYIMGFRKTVDDDNYYAWAKIYMYRNVNGNGYAPGPGEFDIVSAYCDDMAFCTVPDYPLMWGQTNIPEGVEENKETNDNAFVVYPNPTNGVLFVETQNFASLPDQTFRIINLMGQTLLQGHITAETQQINNIENLPAGLYFISVGEQTMKFVVR